MNDLLALVIACALGFGAGWSWQGSRADARVNDLTAQHEKETGDAARDAGIKLKLAEDLADHIDADAAIRTATLERKLQETQHALKTATRNRPCLGGPALRVLDRAPGIRLGTAEAALASPLYGGSAGPAPDPEDQGEDGYSTDTQIAGWIADAGTLYERCRARIRDIRAWTEGTAGTRPALMEAAHD